MNGNLASAKTKQRAQFLLFLFFMIDDSIDDVNFVFKLYFHIAMCLRVLRDALVSGGRALLQARGLWLEQNCIHAYQ